MIEEETKSQGIQSIEVGMDILKKIAEAGKPLSITEIAILCEIYTWNGNHQARIKSLTKIKCYRNCYSTFNVSKRSLE